MKNTKRSRTTAFEIHSPLLAGKILKNRETCMENVAPFWALLRCAGPRAKHNMELENIVFSDSGYEAKACKYPKLQQTVEFSVGLPIVRNVCNIEKGDILCLPFDDE